MEWVGGWGARHDIVCSRSVRDPPSSATNPLKNHLGACSWSLQAERLDDLAARIADVGVRYVQLGLDPVVHGAWKVTDVRPALDARGIELRSGMLGMKGEDYSTLETIKQTGGLRSDEYWAENLAAAERCALAARELEIDLVSFHAGFLPHDQGDPERALLIDRIGQVADAFAAQGVRLALETGQENAETLLAVLDELDRPNLGVNFDPANMILYAMGDPVAALNILAPRVFQIHIKDATATEVPGTWGAEVPAGTGDVDWRAFFECVAEKGLSCDLMIEREAGETRIADMRAARELLEGLEVVEVSR